MEQHDLVEPVQELRPEGRANYAHHLLAHRIDILALLLAREILRSEVRCQDDQRVLEVHRAPLTVGEATVVEHLQEHVEHVRMRLLDLVEQHDLVGDDVAPPRSAHRPRRNRHIPEARRSASRPSASPCTRTCRCAPWRARRRTGRRRASWSAPSCRRRWAQGT